jgi:hypothetical protein
VSLLVGSPNVDGNWCFQKTLVFALQSGGIQAELMVVNGVYSNLGKEIQREHGERRWSLLAEKGCFSFSGAF